MMRTKRLVWMLCLLAAMGFLLVGKARAAEKKPEVVRIKVGHVGHDHHTALFVALDLANEYAAVSGINAEKIKDRHLYRLTDKGKAVAEIEIVKVGGGSKMPTALAQNVIEVGLGGTAPVLAAVDKGAPLKLIAPLHSRGDMLVVKPDMPVKDWQSFVKLVKDSKKPVRVGYKNPVAVAKLVFEEALRHEGLTFSGDPADANVNVHMINVKGGGKLNPSLAGGLVDAYVGNNPFPAVGEEKGILKVVCELEKLPPGTMRDHPCCCVAAGTKAIKEKSEVIELLLILMLQANETIEKDRPRAAKIAARWIGTNEKVELKSMATSGYSMDTGKNWHMKMAEWLTAMEKLGVLDGSLKGLNERKAAKKAYDLEMIEKAKKRFDKCQKKHEDPKIPG